MPVRRVSHLLVALLLALTWGVPSAQMTVDIVGAPASNGSSDGTLHAEDYGVACDGATNSTAAMQEALDAAKTGFQGQRLSMPLATGDCVITGTLLLSEVTNFSLRGNGVTFRWAGPPGIPLFLFQDVQHSTLSYFSVSASTAFPLEVAFQFQNGAGGSLISSANHLDHVKVECTNGGCNYGIRMALGAGDANNEFHRFTFMSIANVAHACARIDHSQSKHHLFEDFNCSNNNLGEYVIQNMHGSFHCIRCTGGHSTLADFLINESFDQMVIDSGDFEGSKRLLVTGGPSGGSLPVTIRNTRWSINGLHADNEAIQWRYRGPLILENNVMEPGTAHRALTIRFDPGGTFGSFSPPAMPSLAPWPILLLGANRPLLKAI